MKGYLKDRGDGVIERAEGGSGGGVRTFNMEYINKDEEKEVFIVHGAKINDLKTVFYLDFVDDEPITVLFAYSKLWDGNESFSPISDGFYGGPYFIDGEYLDGVKVYSKKVT